VLYLLAILLPPVAVLLAGKPFQAVVNFFLCFFLWIPGVIHAIFVVHNHYADKRTERLIEAQNKTAQEQVAAMQAMTNQQLAATKAQMEMQAAQDAAATQAAAPQAATSTSADTTSGQD
jgi:uncharacterized membrane protein YqaE (UPF0057 family)